jgi:glycerate-2-kinase
MSESRDAAARARLMALYRVALAHVHGRSSVARAIGELELAAEAPAWQVLAAGKASASMTAGALDGLGARLQGGLAVTRDEDCTRVGPVAVSRAGHPLPDARSAEAAERALAYAASLRDGDALLVLLSGGASALWAAPAPGISLTDKRALTDRLLRAGAPIADINAVRRRLSRIKGGGLARAAGAALRCTLAISDVAGDLPEAIGSGPTVSASASEPDVLAVLERYGIGPLPAAVQACLVAERPRLPPAREDGGEARCVVVASLSHALAAVQAAAGRDAIAVRSLGASLYGEARALAEPLRQHVLHARASSQTLLVAGGEPTVTVRGGGRGGRAQELALAFALATDDLGGVYGLFVGTDGSDGVTEAAGAFVSPGALSRARGAGIDPAAALEANDSHAFHRATGGVVETGPTGTNVTDLALVWVE